MDMPSTDQRLLTIGEFSRLSRISIRMLRHYDEHGVLHPTRVDPWSGYRSYSPDLLRTARRVGQLRDVGLGVAELAACVGALEDSAMLRTVLERHRERLRSEATAVADRLWEVDHLITTLEEPIMSIGITHKTLPSRTVASLRSTIPSYSEEGRLWERLGAGLEAAGARIAPDALAVTVFHDEGFVEANPDVELQLDVAGPFDPVDDVRYLTVPEQQIATATLHGGYDGVSAVLEAIGRWAGDNDYRFAGPMFNIYVVGPGMEPDPADWVTEVCAPVTKEA